MTTMTGDGPMTLLMARGLRKTYKLGRHNEVEGASRR